LDIPAYFGRGWLAQKSLDPGQPFLGATVDLVVAFLGDVLRSVDLNISTRRLTRTAVSGIAEGNFQTSFAAAITWSAVPGFVDMSWSLTPSRKCRCFRPENAVPTTSSVAHLGQRRHTLQGAIVAGRLRGANVDAIDAVLHVNGPLRRS
jgi:hypothetical protein